MGRTLHTIIRFLVGIIAITFMLHFFGITWTDLGKMTAEGLRGIFDILGILKDFQNSGI